MIIVSISNVNISFNIEENTTVEKLLELASKKTGLHFSAFLFENRLLRGDEVIYTVSRQSHTLLTAIIEMPARCDGEKVSELSAICSNSGQSSIKTPDIFRSSINFDPFQRLVPVARQAGSDDQKDVSNSSWRVIKSHNLESADRSIKGKPQSNNPTEVDYQGEDILVRLDEDGSSIVIQAWEYMSIDTDSEEGSVIALHPEAVSRLKSGGVDAYFLELMPDTKNRVVNGKLANSRQQRSTHEGQPLDEGAQQEIEANLDRFWHILIEKGRQVLNHVRGHWGELHARALLLFILFLLFKSELLGKYSIPSIIIFSLLVLTPIALRFIGYDHILDNIQIRSLLFHEIDPEGTPIIAHWYQRLYAIPLLFIASLVPQWYDQWNVEDERRRRLMRLLQRHDLQRT